MNAEFDFKGCDALNTTVRFSQHSKYPIWLTFFFSPYPSWKSSSVHTRLDSEDHGGPSCRRSSRLPTFIWRRGRSTTLVSCFLAISLARLKASWLWWLSILSRAFVVCVNFSCRFLLTEKYIGTLFWETRVWTLLGLESVFPFNWIPNLPLNESVMCIAACGLVVNIVHACLNVYASRTDSTTIRSHTRETNPLSLLLPFLLPVAIQVAWLSHPTFHHSEIVYSALFVPFLCAWGIQFAHQVGRMILAHVTLGSEAFPCWDWMWMWNAVGALDANLPRLFGR